MKEITRRNLEKFLDEYLPPIRFRGKYWDERRKKRVKKLRELRTELLAALAQGKMFVMEVHYYHVRDREPFSSIH